MNAWCTAVQAPAPTATSPDARAFADGSNSGASTTHRNDHCVLVDQPAAAADLQPGRAEQRLRRRRLPRREEHGVPRARRRRAPARPARSASDRFFAVGPPSSPSSPTRTYASPRAPRDFAQSCQPSSSLRDCDAPPGITTAPTYGAWNTRNGVSAKYAVHSTSSLAEPQVRLVAAVPAHRVGVGHPGQRQRRARGRSAATARPRTVSATSMTSSWSTKLISMSSWVNSGCRSARKSSSR